MKSLTPRRPNSLLLGNIMHASFLHLLSNPSRKLSTKNLGSKSDILVRDGQDVTKLTVPEKVSSELYHVIDDFRKLTPSRKEAAKKGVLEDWQLNEWYQKLLSIAKSVDPNFIKELEYIRNKNPLIIILDGIESGRFRADDLPASIGDLDKEQFWRAAYPANILSYFYNRALGSVERTDFSWVFAVEREKDNVCSYRNGGNLDLHNDGWEARYFDTTSFYGLAGTRDIRTVFVTSDQIIKYYLAKGDDGMKMLDALSENFCMGYDITVSDQAPILDRKGELRFSKSAAATETLIGMNRGGEQDFVIGKFCQDLAEISPALDICIMEDILVRFCDKRVLHGRVVDKNVDKKEKTSIQNPKADRLLFREHGNQK